jgi:hypothetical protein
VDSLAGAQSCDEVVDLFFEYAVFEVGAAELEEVSDAGTGERCDRAAVGDA